MRAAVESGVTGDLGGERQLSSEQMLGTDGETTSGTSNCTKEDPKGDNIYIIYGSCLYFLFFILVLSS